MDISLSGYKVAILAANGFSEQDVTQIQRVLRQAGADIRIVSSDQGLISGWNGTSWGLNFAVDVPLSSALGTDYSALVIPGGSRSLDKLKLTAHTKRFIGSFMETSKPVVVMNDALNLLVISDLLKGRTVSGSGEAYNDVLQAGGLWDEAAFHVDDNLMTGTFNEEQNELIAQVVEFFVSCASVERAA